MFKIDDKAKIIYITRADNACFTVTVEDDEGNEYEPSLNDKLIFSVAEDWGEEPLFSIVNVYEGIDDAFYDFYIEPDHTADLDFGDYVFDVQLEERSTNDGELMNTETVIGKTDTVTPKFVVWEEVS